MQQLYHFQSAISRKKKKIGIHPEYSAKTGNARFLIMFPF